MKRAKTFLIRDMYADFIRKTCYISKIICDAHQDASDKSDWLVSIAERALSAQSHMRRLVPLVRPVQAFSEY